MRRGMTPPASIAIGPQWSADQRAGTGQLRLPRGVVRLVTLIAATAPGPSLVTFARLPLAGPVSVIYCLIMAVIRNI